MVNNGEKQGYEEMDFVGLIKFFWHEKITILSISTVVGILSIIFALVSTNIYEGRAVLMPLQQQSSGLLSSIPAGLSSLTGVKLNQPEKNNTVLALEMLVSRKFIMDFVERRQILVPLMAAEGWNKETNKAIIDSDVYDVESNTWLLDDGKPTLFQAYLEFSERFGVQQDEETGIVNITFRSPVPEHSQKWVVWIVEDINEVMRLKDVEESARSIQFLRRNIRDTEVLGIKNIFFKLIEEQIKKQLIAETKIDYVFEIIDPAIVPEKRASPRRYLIVIVGGFVGFIFSLIFVLGRRAFLNIKEEF